MVNRVKLNIYNTDYAVVSSENQEYMEDLGLEIDQTIRKIMSNDSSMSLTKALVLCGLTYLDKSYKAEATSDHLRSQINSYSDDARSATEGLLDLQKEISALKKENQQLKSQLLASGMPKEFREGNEDN